MAALMKRVRMAAIFDATDGALTTAAVAASVVAADAAVTPADDGTDGVVVVASALSSPG